MVTLRIKNNRNRLQDLLSNLQSQEEIKEIAANAVANPVKQLVERGFNKTKTPFDERWKELKKPNGKRPLEGLRDFFDVHVEGKRVILTHKKEYAKYHQDGTKYIPRRQFLPDLVIPTNWQQKLRVPIQKAIVRYLRDLASKERASSSDGDGDIE